MTNSLLPVRFPNTQGRLPISLFRTTLIGPEPRLAISEIGSGEPVIFLHGVGGNRKNWDENLPVFGQHFRAIAWDARGYGDSNDYDGPLNFRDFSDDLLRVLDVLGLERAHVVGLSMGSWIAMDFAITYPERLRSVVLCCTHAGFSFLSDAAKAEFVRSRKEPLINGMEPKDIAGPVAKSLVSPSAPNHIVAALAESMAILHKDSYLKSIEALVETDFREDLPDLHCPCLVLSGAEDPLTTAAMGREVSDLIPGAHYVVIDGAGHLPNIEKPANFNASVLKFLLSQSRK